MRAFTSQKKLYVLLPNLDLGGAERVVVTLLRYFDRMKFDCCLVVLGRDDGALAAYLPSDIRVIYLNKPRVLLATPALVCLLWRAKPDLIFTNLSHLNLVLAMVRFLLSSKIKIIARESNVVSINVRQYQAHAIWSFFYKIFYRRLDKIVCQSMVMQNDLIENFCVPVEKTVVILNPVDVNAIKTLAKKGEVKVIPQRGTDSFRFVFVGDLRPQKRVDRLLKAFAIIPKGLASLDIIGDGVERQMLHNLCNDLALSDRVRFVGFQPNPYGWIDVADALLLTSDFEGAPNVVLEALALATPVISTPANGTVSELLANQSGCLISQESTAESFAEAMNDWLKLRNEAPSKRAVSHHDVTQIKRQYEEQFLGLLS